MSVSNIQVTFNDNDLNQVSGLTITNREVNLLPNRELQSYPLAKADKSILTSSNYLNKKITIEGAITLSSRALAEQSLDLLKSLVQDQQGSLKVLEAGDIRTYYATMSAMSTRLSGGYVRFGIEFLCSDPLGYHVGQEILIAGTANTNSTAVIPLTVAGSYKAEPEITANISALTGGTTKTVTLANAADNIGISVTRTWTAGDILVVDSYNRSVLVNNSEVEYAGRFPSFAPGSRSLAYTDDLTTRTVLISASYTKRWL